MARPPTIPLPYQKAILWCQSRAPKWLANRATLQITEQEAQQMQALTDAAAQSAMELRRARERYRSAAAECRVHTAAMREHAGGLISRFRAVARTSATPQAIYAAAGLCAPDKRSPTPAPRSPSRFDVTLLSTGALRIAFDCKHPRGVRGVTYRVERLVSATGALDGGFQFLTTAKTRSFTDDAIPPGTAVAIYKVTPQTSTRDGREAIHMVLLASHDLLVASALPQAHARAA